MGRTQLSVGNKILMTEDKLPHVWRSAQAEKITVVYPDRTDTYNLVDKDKGEDRTPEPLNNRFLGPQQVDYYSGWNILARGDEDSTRLPMAFQRNDIVEIVYRNRTEIYRKHRTYPKGSNGRIYEEMSQKEYENYYRNNGYRKVAP